jgi:ribonuclease HI
MKAVDKACELAREMSGQLKAVAIYTDSTSAIHAAQKPHHPLGRHIIRKARTLTKFGPTISLHWCPGHSNVSDIIIIFA